MFTRYLLAASAGCNLWGSEVPALDPTYSRYVGSSLSHHMGYGTLEEREEQEDLEKLIRERI